MEYNEKEGSKPPKKLPTWEVLIHGIVNYSREMGWDNVPAENWKQKPQGGDHKVRPVKQGTENKLKENKCKPMQREFQKWRDESWRKALSLGIHRAAIDDQLTGIILSLIVALQKWGNNERKEHMENNPSLYPRKYLQGLK